MTKRALLAGLAALLVGGQANASTIGLFEYGFNVDGDLTPAGVNDALFDYGTGLGTLRLSVGGAGAHSVLAFFDHEIDEISNTFFNELGDSGGVPSLGQSWEVDEPGHSGLGDIYTNFIVGILDNSNNIDGVPEDVSLAMGWSFDLGAGETAVVTFSVDELLAPPKGLFYLSHTDPDSGVTIFLTSALRITGGPGPIPEPGTLVLLSLGLLGVAAAVSRRRRSFTNY